jgi:hypothetical protein
VSDPEEVGLPKVGDWEETSGVIVISAPRWFQFASPLRRNALLLVRVNDTKESAARINTRRRFFVAVGFLFASAVRISIINTWLCNSAK